MKPIRLLHKCSKTGIVMDRFGIRTNCHKDIDLKTTKVICDYLMSHGKICLKDDDFRGNAQRLAEQIDCLLVLGGDGTLIQAARKYAPYGVPILGINLGTMGFLASVEKENVIECLDALMADQCIIKNRMLLYGKTFRGEQLIKESVAVNDIIVNRAGFSRLVEMKLYINDDLVDIYAADGLIVSTPTGSTGYNLSAGGPIIYPETEMMVITPICPHSLSSRSIVVSGHEKVVIEVGRRSKTQEEEALVTYDGQVVTPLTTYDRVEISQADIYVRLIEINERSFYQVLRDKIGHA